MRATHERIKFLLQDDFTAVCETKVNRGEIEIKRNKVFFIKHDAL